MIRDYNNVFLSGEESYTNTKNRNNNNISNNENSSLIFRNHNDFTWDYYEIDQTYMKYIDTNK